MKKLPSLGSDMRFLIMAICLLASPAWGDQKEWKAKDMNEAPPVIAAEDTVRTERVSKAGKLDIAKLRGIEKKNSLMVGEYTVEYLVTAQDAVAVEVSPVKLIGRREEE